MDVETARNWTFILDDYHDIDRSFVESFVDRVCDYVICSIRYRVDGTSYLQGYLNRYVMAPCRMKPLKDLLPDATWFASTGVSTAHIAEHRTFLISFEFGNMCQTRSNIRPPLERYSNYAREGRFNMISSSELYFNWDYYKMLYDCCNCVTPPVSGYDVAAAQFQRMHAEDIASDAAALNL
jgi:hypothetical protein